jgi:D-alanine-D-alanine ligase-like ATP-grasp enzyme
MEHQQDPIRSHPHYPLHTRLLIELFLGSELPAIQTLFIEPEYGHVGRIVYRNGAVRFFRGACAGVNSHSAAEVARDKGYTKFFLQNLGYATPTGKTFLLPAYIQTIDQNLARYGFTTYAHSEAIYTYIDSVVGYPCFIKPNEGSQGKGIYKCLTPDDVQTVLARYQREKVNVLLVEAAIAYPDYRVVVWRNQMIACYLRRPLFVVGDGDSTIRELLIQRQESMNRAGRHALINLNDPRLHQKLRRNNYTLDTVLCGMEEIELQDVSNLSIGGEAEDYTARMHPRWVELCARISADMGLGLCGIDIACADIEDPDSAYSVFEINAAPGLENYAALGPRQAALVRDFYRRVFSESPAVQA